MQKTLVQTNSSNNDKMRFKVALGILSFWKSNHLVHQELDWCLIYAIKHLCNHLDRVYLDAIMHHFDENEKSLILGQIESVIGINLNEESLKIRNHLSGKVSTLESLRVFSKVNIDFDSKGHFVLNRKSFSEDEFKELVIHGLVKMRNFFSEREIDELMEVLKRIKIRMKKK